MKTTDTALLGHSGTRFLSASSLADFWTMSIQVFLMDTILPSYCGQSFGAKNYDAVAIWTQVSTTLYSWIFIPVFVGWCMTAPLMFYVFGESWAISYDAGYYAGVLALCLPARFVTTKMGSFFNSQAITRPSLTATILGLMLNLVFGLQLVLGIPYPGLAFGFWACPIVTASVEYLILAVYVVVFVVILKYHAQCWTAKAREWNFVRDVFVGPVLGLFGVTSHFSYYNDNIRPRLWEYTCKAVPATLALASDFWRMAAIGAIAAWIGATETGVFNASYRFAWMNVTVIGSFSSAAVTLIGIALGTGDGLYARRIVIFAVLTVTAFLTVTTTVTVIFIEDLGRIFSSDPEVLSLFSECRLEIGAMIFFMCFAMHFEQILLNLRRSAYVFRSGLIGSWCGQVPISVLLMLVNGKQLKYVYLGVGSGYMILMVLYAFPFLSIDWVKEAHEAAERSRKTEPLITNEETEADA